MNQLISEEIVFEALQSITMMKMELIDARERQHLGIQLCSFLGQT